MKLTPINSRDYAVRFYSDATQSVMTVEADNRNAGGNLWHRLPPGIYSLRLHLDGVSSEGAHLRWEPDGAPLVAMCAIAPGTVRNRTSESQGVITSRTGGRFTVVPEPAPNGGLNGGTRAAVVVSPVTDYRS